MKPAADTIAKHMRMPMKASDFWIRWFQRDMASH
jgi:hypothetical protein